MDKKDSISKKKPSNQSPFSKNVSSSGLGYVKDSMDGHNQSTQEQIANKISSITTPHGLAHQRQSQDVKQSNFQGVREKQTPK